MTHLKTEPNLIRAVSAAYRTRLKYSPWRAEFDVFLPLSTDRRLRVCTYQTFCERHGLSIQDLLRSGASPDGFTIAKTLGGKNPLRWLILYNDDGRSQERKRFTIAHELGHVMLRHTEESEVNDAEADCFARNLLTPALYAQENNLTFDKYPLLFGISKAAAHVAEKNYELDLSLVTGAIRKEWETRLGEKENRRDVI